MLEVEEGGGGGGGGGRGGILEIETFCTFVLPTRTIYRWVECDC